MIALLFMSDKIMHMNGDYNHNSCTLCFKILLITIANRQWLTLILKLHLVTRIIIFTRRFSFLKFQLDSHT